MTSCPPVIQLQPPSIPVKVQAAFSYLFYCNAVTIPQPVRSQTLGRMMVRRKLSTLEEGAKNAALNLLRNWFNGEIELESGQGMQGLDFSEEQALGLDGQDDKAPPEPGEGITSG